MPAKFSFNEHVFLTLEQDAKIVYITHISSIVTYDKK